MSKLRCGLPLVMAAILVVPSCGYGEKTAKVSVADVVGEWAEPGGASFALSDDRTFKASGLKADFFADSQCPPGKVSGSWGFWVDKSDALSVVSEKAASGSWIGLSFNGVAQGDCNIDLAAVDGGRRLCASIDPDNPCDFDAKFSREP
ncbi:hypothetical protein [Streptomyces sp. NPDC051214]|uniref:hypothetical protein n=1 Tax=Streptomyces sp. NPDC051214 TaxID=3155282 RepID=UPI00342DC6A7